MLADFLILPVQRVTRYVMLMDALLSVTKEGHPDYLATVKAKAKLEVCEMSFRSIEEIHKAHQLTCACNVTAKDFEDPGGLSPETTEAAEEA